jgi:hypothetical protein
VLLLAVHEIDHALIRRRWRSPWVAGADEAFA